MEHHNYDIVSSCCSPRNREERVDVVASQTHRGSDLAGYLTSTLLSRIVKLEEQVNDLKVHVYSPPPTNLRHPQYVPSETKPPVALTELHQVPLGRPRVALADSQQMALHQRTLVTPDKAQSDSHQSYPRAEALSLESIEVTEDLSIKSKNFKQVKEFIEDAIGKWEKQMDDTKCRLEQAVSLLRVRMEQTLLRINDLKTLSTPQSAALEARIVDLEESRVNREPKLTSAVILATQAKDEVPHVEDQIVGGLEAKAVHGSDQQLASDSATETAHFGSSIGDAKANGNMVLGGLPEEEEEDLGNRRSLDQELPIARETFAKVDPQYTFAESIWDAYLFAGEPEIGVLGSIVVLVLFILNVVLQISFCVICSIALNSNPFDDESIQGLNEFRMFTSHDNRYMDFFTGASLSRRLCQPDSSSFLAKREIYATTQIEVLTVIDDYLGDEGSGSLLIFRGQVMCMLALLCWAFNVAREAKNTWHFHTAMRSLKVESRSELSLSGQGKHKIIIDSLSYGQFAKYIMIVLLRTGICLFMLYTGCMWLSFTLQIEDLLLNAVGLEFVLSVDELVFAAAVPRQTKVFMASLAPVKEKNWVFYKGVDKLSVTVLVLTPALAFLFYFNYVVYLVDQMLLAKASLCDNDLDFVFSVDVTGFLWFETTPAEPSKPPPMQYAQKSSLSSRTQRQPTEIGMELPFFWLTTAEAMQNLNWDELVSSNSGCRDMITNSHATDVFSDTHISWFRRQLSNSSISSCTDLQSMGLCGKFGNRGPETRWLCSATCECNSPTSISPPHHASGGCPQTCEISGEYALKLNAMGCADMTLEALNASAFWQNWATYTKEALYSINLETIGNSMYNSMLASGCNFVATTNEKIKICSGSTELGLRPLAPICPVTCGCTTTWLQQCPQTCIGLYLLRNQSVP